MAKDPAFLFYSKDWLTDTAELSDSEVRILIDLMCYNHVNGDLPSDKSKLSFMTRRSLEDFDKHWDSIKDKFIPNGTPNGERLVNRKLSKVIGERSEKATKNKLIGTFAHVIKKLKLNKKDLTILKSRFNVDELLKINTEWNTERLTEWCLNGTPFIEDVNGDEDVIEDSFLEEDWRENFGFYQKQLSEAHLKLKNNSEWISTQEKFNPNLDILLSVEKAITNFWGKEAGWKHKKKSKTKIIDWESTLTKAIDMNKVYKQRDNGNNQGTEKRIKREEWKTH